MSTQQSREYYRRYMKEYYHKHKDYWKNYYLQRKQRSTRSRRVSSRDRRHYLQRIDAAWSQTHSESTSLNRFLRRLSRTSVHNFDPDNPPPSSKWIAGKGEIKINPQFGKLLSEILTKEDFRDIKFPAEKINPESRHEASTFQALALKDDKKCIVEAVTTPFKVFTTKRREYLKAFLSFFGARYFLCFIKPDLSKYHLMELEPSRIRSIALGLKIIETMKPTNII